MSIWSYQDTLVDEGAIRTALSCQNCVFCSEVLRVLRNESQSEQVHQGLHEESVLHVRTCDNCGWWWARRNEYRQMENVGKYKVIDPTEYHEDRMSGVAAVLKKLDLTDISVPICEVRDYLAARFNSRFELNPRLFEETVASVFGDLGYRATATAYSGDDGIDVVLEGANGETVGVQVKRYKERIGVGQIRELAGSLLLQGLTEGIFVTTSDYQSGAKTTADRYQRLRGMRIDLLNAERFYEQLQLAQRNRYRSLQEADAPYLSAQFVSLQTEKYQESPDRRFDL